MFKTLIDKVRVQGRISLGDGVFLRDQLPIIYSGEAKSNDTNSTHYHSSGGRSLIIDRGGTTYRVKGCDPSGKLTERVAGSKENKVEDVFNAYQLAALNFPNVGFMFRAGKPFGVLNLSQVELERGALKQLERAYNFVGIENPCEFAMYADTGILADGERTYQTVFTLPGVEADFRVKEFEKLLTERLDECSTEEIAKKQKNINRLFGRFVYWAGVSTGLLASVGVSPVKSSFASQNWVISKYKNGYGLFRVDHSSTKIVSPEEAYNSLIAQENDLPHIVNNFSVFPGRVQVAANPQVFHVRKNKKFSEILYMTKGIGADESNIIRAHQNIFNLGALCGVAAVTGRSNAINPIPEEMFAEALA